MKRIGRLPLAALKQPDSPDDYNIYQGRYPHDGAICIVIGDPDEPYAIFSKNLRSYGARIDEDEFHVDLNNMGKEMVERMMATGLFVNTGRADEMGFCIYPVWRLK